jgi:hypothetical protein
MLLTIAAQDVRVGDEIYNPRATHAPFRWNRIRAITKSKISVRLEGGAVKEIDGFAFDCGYLFSKTRDEAVCVRRRG